MSSVDMRTELLLDQAIKRRLNALVCRATRTARLLHGTQMEESQLRNLIHTAGESRSVEVVTNFIRYQIARNGRAWDTSSTGFGHTVIHDLHQPITDMAAQITDDVVGRLGTTPSVDTTSVDTAVIQAEAFTKLMLLYLGYLNRAFYYAKKMSDFATLDTVIARCPEEGTSRPAAQEQRR